MSQQQVEELRRDFAALAEDAVPREDCPAPDLLWAAVRGEAAHGDVRRVLDHIASCASCAMAWRLGIEVERESVISTASDAQAESSVAPWARWWPGMVAAAALVVVSIGAGVLWRHVETAPATSSVTGVTESVGEEGGTFRGEEGREIRSLVAAEEPLARSECTLRWSLAPGAVYDLWVESEDLEPIAEVQGLDQAEYQIPAADLDGLGAGTSLLWRVEATLVDGERIRSATFQTWLE